MEKKRGKYEPETEEETKKRHEEFEKNQKEWEKVKEEWRKEEKEREKKAKKEEKWLFHQKVWSRDFNKSQDIKDRKKEKEKRNNEIYDLYVNKGAKITGLSKKYDLSRNYVRTILDKELARRAWDRLDEQNRKEFNKEMEINGEMAERYSKISKRNRDSGYDEEGLPIITTEMKDLKEELSVFEAQNDLLVYERHKRENEMCKLGNKFMKKDAREHNTNMYCHIEEPEKRKYKKQYKYRGERSKFGKKVKDYY